MYFIKNDESIYQSNKKQEKSDKEISKEDFEKRLKELMDHRPYYEKRLAEYPPIGEQLDMMFHDFEAWKAKIQEIKDKYPKEESDESKAG